MRERTCVYECNTWCSGWRSPTYLEIEPRRSRQAIQIGRGVHVHDPDQTTATASSPTLWSLHLFFLFFSFSLFESRFICLLIRLSSTMRNTVAREPQIHAMARVLNCSNVSISNHEKMFYEKNTQRDPNMDFWESALWIKSFWYSY